MKPELSIIIVNWNKSRLLEECLTSLWQKPRRIGFETIVIDNASTDDSAAMVRRQFSQVKLLVNQRNLGFARANNQGIKASQGEFILFLNNDAQVLGDSLEQMADHLRRQPAVGAVGGRLVSPEGRPDLSCGHYPTPWSDLFSSLGLEKLFSGSRWLARHPMTYWDHGEIAEVDYVSGADLMARRQALDEAGFFDEDFFLYCEDAELCFRLKQKGWQVKILPQARFIHHRGQSPARPSESVFKESRRSRLLFYKKHYGRGSVAAARIIFSAVLLARIVLLALAKTLNRKRFLAKQPSTKLGFYGGTLKDLWRF